MEKILKDHKYKGGQTKKLMGRRGAEFCDICGKKVEHEHRLRVCLRCLEHGYKVISSILTEEMKVNKKEKE